VIISPSAGVAMPKLNTQRAPVYPLVAFPPAAAEDAAVNILPR